jgi:L-iditol 2-dehydrogenase
MSNEVLVAISFCGVCGTDVKILHDHHAYYRPPLILGHEFSGVVADVGADVTGISVGDAVVVPPSPIRVESLEARARSPWQTGVRDGFEAEWGFTTYGGFTKYGVFGAERIVKLPDGVDVESAALVEPLSVCVHAVLDNASVRATDVVVVSGAGAIGLLTAQLAKAQGATVVVLGIGVDEHRLALAKSLGADAVVNTERDDPEDVTLDLSQGAGADVVFECVGAEASVVNCIRLVRRGGHYVQVGTSASVMSVEFAQIAYKELTVKGNLAATRINWEHAVKLIAMGKIQTKPLVSHKLPFSDWEHGFALAEEKRSVKVLLYPG